MKVQCLIKIMMTLTASLLLGALAQATDVQVSVDTKIVRDGKTELVKGGSIVHVDLGQSFLAVPEGGVPVLVYLPLSAKSKLTLSEADLKNALDIQIRPQLEEATAAIVNGLRKAENLMQHKDHEQALLITDNLKKKYAPISSVLFLSGTLHFLLNQRSAAIEDLQNGLEIDPKNEAAKKLLAQIKNSSTSRSDQ